MELGLLYLLATIMIVFFGLVLSLWTAWLLYIVFKTGSYQFLKINLCLMGIFDVFYTARGFDLSWSIYYDTADGIPYALDQLGYNGVLMILLWRVAYMYWLPSKQMQVWQETKESEEDPNLLLEKF